MPEVCRSQAPGCSFLPQVGTCVFAGDERDWSCSGTNLFIRFRPVPWRPASCGPLAFMVLRRVQSFRFVRPRPGGYCGRWRGFVAIAKIRGHVVAFPDLCAPVFQLRHETLVHLDQTGIGSSGHHQICPAEGHDPACRHRFFKRGFQTVRSIKCMGNEVEPVPTWPEISREPSAGIGPLHG